MGPFALVGAHNMIFLKNNAATDIVSSQDNDCVRFWPEQQNQYFDWVYS